MYVSKILGLLFVHDLAASSGYNVFIVRQGICKKVNAGGFIMRLTLVRCLLPPHK